MMARCKCPNTGKEEWHNAKTLSIPKHLRNGAVLVATVTVKNMIRTKETLFICWETATFYEWRMKSGNVLQLRQDFIDGLSPADRRYLCMNR
jgi:hypothetical protein